VPAGDAFTTKQQDEIQRTISLAEKESDLRYSVYVGTLAGDTREHARRLHAALGDEAPRTVLVALDPGSRHLEIVTGTDAARRLDDRSCTLAALSMTTTFSAGDLSGGITKGLLSLAEHARSQRVLHTDEP
jgi:uncharacterized membrane protein YgcG